MKKITLALAILMTSFASADYSKKELKNMSKKELISTVTHLQEQLNHHRKKHKKEKHSKNLMSQIDIEYCLAFSSPAVKITCFKNRVSFTKSRDCKRKSIKELKIYCLTQARRPLKEKVRKNRVMGERDKQFCLKMTGAEAQNTCRELNTPEWISTACEKASTTQVKLACLRNY